MIPTLPINAHSLRQAEVTTLRLFKAVEAAGLIVAGKTESQLASEIDELGRKHFNIEQHWHKKIVRAGRNTLSIYRDDPPDRVIEADDILFIDFGPIVAGYEADLGRTYVLGNDPVKQKLKADVERAWYALQAFYREQHSLRASDLFHRAVQKAKESGWTFTGDIAGHIIGLYPHEQPDDPKSLELDIHPDNDKDIFARDAQGNKRHWILELQFVDRALGIGAYFEQLL